MIGVVGVRDDALLAALRGAGATVKSSHTDRVDACDLVVAVGGDALADLVDAAVSSPVLPVECGPAPLGVSLDAAIDAADRLAASDFDVRSSPRLTVTVDGDRRRPGLLDVVLRAEEPARISEYVVTTGRRTRRFRADGVVVATPLGSSGYARTAGGPVLDPGSNGLVIVPIAAFALGVPPRVTPVERDLTLTVERDEAAVVLDTDGRAAGPVPTGAPVRVTVDGTLGIAVLRGHGTETL